MCRQFFVVACLLLWMSGIDPAFAVADRPQVVPAPDLRQLHAEKADLGVWDDVLSHPDWDIVVLRRKNELFKLCLESPFDVSPLATVRGVAISQIVAGIQTTDRFWIFVCSHDRFPAAIDLLSGDTVELVVPGVQLPCRHSPRVRAPLVLEHVGAALLSVGSGCRESWPRVENRPVYFSLNLTSGELVQFPVGWDLWAFSADMTIARFGGMTLPTRERAWHAIDLRSGEVADWVGPNAETERTVAFHWSRTQRVQPVSGTSQERHITGLFVNGQVIEFSDPLCHFGGFDTARARGDFVGARTRIGGSAFGSPNPLWQVRIAENPTPRLLSERSGEFAMLPDGGIVFSEAGYGPRGQSFEAYHYNYATDAKWNVLDGVERLPELSEVLQKRSSVTDRMTVRLVEGFGSDPSRSRVACWFVHSRYDLGSGLLKHGQERLQTQHWRRMFIVSSQGKRFETQVWQEQNTPDEIWLHNSGRMLIGTHEWSSDGDSQHVRRVRLRGIAFQMPEP